ncbi:MAG TPA: hypothetical protein VL598_06740 [Trinickia sp.]|jgi:hypothetical protein|uniref:hypothetical protein n=1 Tax=Trinickia sp. TaxID=2571163 RepID=UPI002CFFFD9F|nr:hypothetical protein [Trinickia sp.]HTI17343.1 hypothetical protein [Trinickia sp.]
MSLSTPARLATAIDPGVTFEPDRSEHNLAVYRTIAEEIARLRELDLSARHPAVIFDVRRAYPSWPTAPATATDTSAAVCETDSEIDIGSESV